MSNDEELEKRFEYVADWADFSDVVVFTEFMDDDGEFYHDHVIPTELEFYAIDDMDKAEKLVLLNAADLEKGKGSLTYLRRVREDLQYEKDIKRE